MMLWFHDYDYITTPGLQLREEISIDSWAYSRNYLLSDNLCSEDFAFERKKTFQGNQKIVHDLVCDGNCLHWLLLYYLHNTKTACAVLQYCYFPLDQCFSRRFDLVIILMHSHIFFILAFAVTVIKYLFFHVIRVTASKRPKHCDETSHPKQQWHQLTLHGK